MLGIRAVCIAMWFLLASCPTLAPCLVNRDIDVRIGTGIHEDGADQGVVEKWEGRWGG